MAEKVVLAYSGGLDTSVAIRWIHERYGMDVVTLTADLGGDGTVDGVREKALAALRAGITRVVLPRRNLQDLNEIPADLKKKITFIPVEHMDEVLEAALERPLGAPLVRSGPTPAATVPPSMASAKTR